MFNMNGSINIDGYDCTVGERVIIASGFTFNNNIIFRMVEKFTP